MIEPGTYLLYDARCRRCSLLVEDLHDILAGVIRLADLRDPDTRRFIDSARPAWRFEPMLVSLDGQARVRLSTGLGLRIRVFRLLGIRRSLRAVSVVRKYRVPAIGKGPLGVRPHPAASPEEIATVAGDSTIRLQPDVSVEMTGDEERLRLRFLDREITLPGAAARDVESILSRGHAPFSVDEVHGQLDIAGRIALVQLLLRERALVAVQTARPQAA